MPHILHKIEELERLQAFALEGETRQQQWVLTTILNGKEEDFFYPFIKQHHTLKFAYEVLRTQLSESYTRQLSDERYKNEFIRQLLKIMKWAELLRHVHGRFLFVGREVEELEHDLEVYGYYLNKAQSDYIFSIDAIRMPQEKSPFFGVHIIRKLHSLINLPRLLGLRTRFSIRKLLPLLNNKIFSKLITDLDKVLNPVLAYLGWIFFAPRLFYNFFILLKHVIPHPWMKQTERNLGWRRRLEIHLERRWFELFNDLVWFIVGLLSCYLFLGSFATLAIYFGFGCYGYDILLAGLRAVILIGCYNGLKEDFAEKALSLKSDSQEEPTGEEVALGEFRQLLKERTTVEVKKLILSFAIATGIFLSFSLTLPFLATISPFIPFIGALFFLSVTVAGYIAGQRLEALRSTSRLELPEKLPKVSNHSIFNSKNNVKAPYADPYLSGEASFAV